MIRENLAGVKASLPEGVHLVAVSKTQTIEKIMEAYELGIRDFGENKVQELEMKFEALPKDIRWHFIGGLQTNKVRKLMGKTYLIQSLDRISLAAEINRRAAMSDQSVDTLIEVNIGEEEQKAGINLKDLPGFIEELRSMERIHVRGLMAIIPQGSEEENRHYFHKMKEVFEELKKMESERIHMEILSMGMTQDYGLAIEEGSNMVRVGTGIFGTRNK
jgi:pyridoxal phosphate enzyme (YggS family)